MFHRYSQRPQRSIVYLSIAQERALGCEYPLGDPWGGPAFGEKNKGGFFSSDYWSGGGIVNSVTSFFSDPIGYTGDRLAEFDKTVLQPVGHTLEGVGKAIANDPITFVATVAAVATGNAWMVPIIQGISTAAHGGSIEDIAKTVAISAATTWAGGQIGEYVSNSMGTTVIENGIEKTSYSVFGQAIQQSTAQTIGNVVGYSTTSAIGAAAMGKNGDQILTTALASGAGAALPLVLGNIPGFNELAKGTVEGIPADVSKAIANGIAGVAGSVVSSAITHKDMGAAVAASLITAGVQGLVSTKNIVTDMFKAGGEAVGISNLSTQTQAIVANTLSSVFATALNGGKAGNILQQSMLSIGNQALQKYITTGIKDGASIVDNLFGKSEEVKTQFDEEIAKYQGYIDQRDGIADQINNIVDTQKDLATQYDQADNALDAYLIKAKGYQDQYDSTYSAYKQYVDQANALVGTVNAKGQAANALAGKVNVAAKDVNDAVATQKSYIDAYNQNKPEFDRLLDVYNKAVVQDPTVATNRVFAGEGDASVYVGPNVQVAYGANGQYAYKTSDANGYITFNNATFGDPIQGTYKYGYAITYGGYTGTELNAMKDDITKRAGDLNTWADASNLWADKANTLLGTYNTLNDQYKTAVTDYNNTKSSYDSTATKATSTLNTVNSIAGQLNTVGTAINNTVNTMNGINTQITTLNTEYTQLDGQIKVVDGNIKTSETTLTGIKNNYDGIIGQLNDAAAPLTQQINDMTSKITNDLVSNLDPTFNATEYKKLNGLSDTADAAAHWLSVGKDQGLYTNFEAASAARNEAISTLATNIAQQRGYESGFEVPRAEWAKLISDIGTHYGNDMSALQKATTGSYAWETGTPVTKMLSEFDPNKVEDTASVKQFYGEWNKPINYTPPSGLRLATAEEYATGKAVATTMPSGDVAYTVSDGSQATKVFDKQTGEMVDSTVGWSTTGIKNVTITGADGKPEDVYVDSEGNVVVNVSATKLDTVNPEEQDPLAAMYTFNTMQAGLLGDWSKPGDRIIEGSKAIIKWAEDQTKNGQGSNVLSIASSVVGGFGEQFQSFAGLAALVGGQPQDTDLYKLGQKLIDLQKTSTPADFAQRYADFQAQYQNVTGWEKGWSFVKAVANSPSEFMIGMAIPEIAQEVIPTLLGGGVGKIAGVGASALASVAPKIAAWASKWAGVTASAASDVAESFGSNYNDTYKEAKTLAVKAHPEWSNQQVEEYATQQGMTVGLVGALTTGISMGVGGAELAKSLLGPKATSEAVDGMAGWLGQLATKMTTTGKILTKEGLSEAVVEEMPTQLTRDLLFLSIDPNRDIAGNVSLAGAQAFMTAGATTGTISGAHQTMLSLAEVALNANEAFTKAIDDTHGDPNALNNVLTKWVPNTTAQGQDLRNTIVPAIFDSRPDWALQYATAADYERTVATLGVTDATALTELVNKRFDTAVTTSDELATDLYNKGLIGVTVGDVKNVLGTGTQTPTQVSQAATTYVDQNMVDLQEVKDAAKQEGYTATQNEMDSLVGRGVEADVIQKFVQEIDPKAVTTAEATQYFKDLGYDKATATDIAQFVKSAPEDEVQKAVATWVDPRQVTRQEAINFYAQNGYVPTEAEINKYVVQGADVAQADVQKQLASYVDPKFVSANEVRQAFKDLGLAAPVTMSDIAKLTGQYDQSQLAAKAKEALPVVSSNAAYSLLAGDSFTAQQAIDLVNSQVAKYQQDGLSLTDAKNAAINSVAAQFGVDRSNFLTAIGSTEAEVGLDTNPTASAIIGKIEQYNAKGITGDAAIQAALDTVASGKGVSVSQLLSDMGTTAADFRTYAGTNVNTTEQQLADLAAQKQAAGMGRNEAIQSAVNDLASKLDISRTDLLNSVDITSQQFLNDIKIAQTDANKQMVAFGGQPSTSVLAQLNTDVQSVADLLGKPASQVTATDITMVQNMIDQKTATNLAYDVNQDQKVDAKDLALLQQQQQVQTNTNIQQQVDPNTGLNILVDTTTGKTIDTWNPAIGTQWAPTGIYKTIDDQQKQIENVIKTQTENTKTTQQKQNFNQMMQMVLGAPDVGGQKVTVGTSDPSRINYIYDFNSIFANPQQAGLMPSPYGAINTYGQSAQQGGLGSLQTGLSGQAANQSTYGAPYKMAVGGFAEGGMINSDMSVGDGGNFDDLLNILKGNSG